MKINGTFGTYETSYLPTFLYLFLKRRRRRRRRRSRRSRRSRRFRGFSIKMKIEFSYRSHFLQENWESMEPLEPMRPPTFLPFFFYFSILWRKEKQQDATPSLISLSLFIFKKKKKKKKEEVSEVSEVSKVQRFLNKNENWVFLSISFPTRELRIDGTFGTYETSYLPDRFKWMPPRCF